MNDTEISLLKNEIARQNRIIEALLLHNEQLRAQNAALQSGNSSENSSYSVSEKENAPPNAGYSVTEKGKGTTTNSYSITEKGKGITSDSNSVTEKEKGTTTDSYSIPEKEKGITPDSYSVTEKGNGITYVGSPVPEKVETTASNVVRVHTKLRAMENGKVKRSGSINSAKLLIHFHNGNGGSHPELRKLTGLSKGGLAKLIMSLTKRGLITRSGWQRFSLTAAGRQLLI
jgi:predicted transcriptional regulator